KPLPSANFFPTPDSKPNPSHTVYAVEIGRIEAANSDALNNPAANKMYANSLDSGRNACAASAASRICRTPCAYKVAAHATTMNHATMSVNRQPRITSHREALYSRAVIPFSTIDDCR